MHDRVFVLHADPSERSREHRLLQGMHHEPKLRGAHRDLRFHRHLRRALERSVRAPEPAGDAVTGFLGGQNLVREFFA
jgi:hypothetical protein